MPFHEAKEIFDDAKLYIDPSKDRIIWELLRGLSEMCQGLQSLESEFLRIRSDIAALRP